MHNWLLISIIVIGMIVSFGLGTTAPFPTPVPEIVEIIVEVPAPTLTPEPTPVPEEPWCWAFIDLVDKGTHFSMEPVEVCGIGLEWHELPPDFD